MAHNKLLYQYLRQALEKTHLQYPWRLIFDEKIQSIIVQIYVPVSQALKQTNLVDLANKPISQIDYIEMQLVYGQTIEDYSADDLRYYLAPNINHKYYDKTYIDISLQVLAKLISTVTVQLHEMANGSRQKMHVAWPGELVVKMVNDRKRINRYEATRMAISKEL